MLGRTNQTLPVYLKYLFLLFITTSISTVLFSQRYPFTLIGVKDGLPQSSVFKIAQDQQGYIWMATESGLCRYDGYKFITYSIHNGLGSKFISDIKFDAQNRLWISTMGKGISWFDGKRFHRFDESNGLPSNQVRSLEFTNTNEIIISTLDTGIVRLSKNKKPQIYYLPDGSYFPYQWKLSKLKNGDIISVGRNGACRFKADNNYEYEVLYPATRTIINSYETNNGDIWLAGVQQLVQIKNGVANDRSELLASLDGVKADAWDVFQPKDQPDIYISTSKGVLILKDSTIKWLTVANGLPYEHIMDCFQDSYGNFWVGTYGGGAAILDSKGLDHFDYSDEIIPITAAALMDDKRGNIWLSSDNYGIFWYDGNKIHHHPDPRLQEEILALGMATNPVSHEVWIAGLSGEIVKMKGTDIQFYRDTKPGEGLSCLFITFLPDGTGYFSTQSGVFKMGLNDKDPTWLNELPNIYFRSSFVDNKNNIWFLGDEGELLKWKDGKVEDYTEIINPDNYGMDHGLYDAKHDLFWFCSSGGLIVWNGKGTHLFHSGNGLKSDSPWAITQDSLGRIWVGHEKGVECVDIDNQKITSIGYDQGFTPVETNSCVAMTDSKGDVWFGTISSASRIRIKDMTTDNRTGVLRVQKVHEGKRLVYEETIHDTACPPIQLKYYQNTINIEMAALCYSNAQDVRYSWFLENYDEEWIVDNEHREALYTNLPPGSYKFHAKAIEPNGYETNEVVIKITVLRPFWQRIWFYIAEFSFLGLLIVLSFRFSSNPDQNKLGGFITLLTILIVFESLLLYLSTYINQFTGDVPVFQLVMNVLLAATLNPLEHGIQRVMKNWALRMRKK